MTNNFQEQLTSLGMEYTHPEGFEEIEIKKNPDLQYSYAIFNKELEVEIRYSLFPLEPYFQMFEQAKSNPNMKMVMIDPNQYFTGLLETSAENVTQGAQYFLGEINGREALAQYGADKVLACMFDVNSEFGEGYQYGQFLGLHKDNVADVIITTLSNDKDLLMDQEKVPGLTLRFLAEQPSEPEDPYHWIPVRKPWWQFWK